MILEMMTDQKDQKLNKKVFKAVKSHPDAQGKKITQAQFSSHVAHILKTWRRREEIFEEYTLDEFKRYMSKARPPRPRKNTPVTKFSWGDSKRIVNLFHEIIKKELLNGKLTSIVFWEREAFEIMNEDQTFNDKHISLREFIKHFDYLKRKATDNKERVVIEGYRYGCIKWVQGQEEECRGEYVLLNLEFNTKNLIKKHEKLAENPLK